MTAKRSAYPLPAIINPPERLCVKINIPNEPSHRQAFLGAIYGLTRWFKWDQDGTTKAKQVADVWLSVYEEMLQQFYTGDCSVNFDNFDIRFNGCILEWTDDGVLWHGVNGSTEFQQCILENVPVELSTFDIRFNGCVLQWTADGIVWHGVNGSTEFIQCILDDVPQELSTFNVRFNGCILQWTADGIVWHNVNGSTDFKNCILEDATPEMRVSDGYIQWRAGVDGEWANLISLESLRGDPGVCDNCGDQPPAPTIDYKCGMATALADGILADLLHALDHILDFMVNDPLAQLAGWNPPVWSFWYINGWDVFQVADFYPLLTWAGHFGLTPASFDVNVVNSYRGLVIDEAEKAKIAATIYGAITSSALYDESQQAAVAAALAAAAEPETTAFYAMLSSWVTTLPLDRQATYALKGSVYTLQSEDCQFETPNFEFVSASSSVPEGSSIAVSVRLNIAAGDLNEAATVTFSVGGTATSGTDYQALTEPHTLTFPAHSQNGTIKQITIDTIGDDLAEGPENVVLTITDVSNGEIGANASHTVTILDDDVQTVTIEFDRATAQLGEGLPGIKDFYVVLHTGGGLLAQAVEFDVLVTGGTASAGSDYVDPGTQHFTFPAGTADASTLTGSIATLDDAVYEGNETIILGFQNVTNATAAGNTTLTITIVDDESSACFTGAYGTQETAYLYNNGITGGTYDGSQCSGRLIQLNPDWMTLDMGSEKCVTEIRWNSTYNSYSADIATIKFDDGTTLQSSDVQSTSCARYIRFVLPAPKRTRTIQCRADHTSLGTGTARLYTHSVTVISNKETP